MYVDPTETCTCKNLVKKTAVIFITFCYIIITLSNGAAIAISLEFYF